VAPLLAIDRDRIIPIAQGRAFSHLLRGVVFREFPGCGHYLHNLEPITFAKTVRSFFDESVAVQVTVGPGLAQNDVKRRTGDLHALP
jgi:hypothetical protein